MLNLSESVFNKRCAPSRLEQKKTKKKETEKEKKNFKVSFVWIAVMVETGGNKKKKLSANWTV